MRPERLRKIELLARPLPGEKDEQAGPPHPSPSNSRPEHQRSSYGSDARRPSLQADRARSFLHNRDRKPSRPLAPASRVVPQEDLPPGLDGQRKPVLHAHRHRHIPRVPHDACLGNGHDSPLRVPRSRQAPRGTRPCRIGSMAWGTSLTCRRARARASRQGSACSSRHVTQAEGWLGLLPLGQARWPMRPSPCSIQEEECRQSARNRLQGDRIGR